MTAYDRTLRFLYDLQLFGIKIGLENIRALLDNLGHPEQRYPCVHIAGTNGKGSTAAMIASVLTASGYRTGLYTSPHLVHFTERIRIDGVKISEEEVVSYTKQIKPVVRRLKATFFETTTAIAFQWFADRRVDIAVVETGLGGRWDATNVVTPLVSVITGIGLDHQEYLGTTLARIAFEKAGIIKRGVPCVVGCVKPEAENVIRTVARSKRSKLLFASRGYSVQIEKRGVGGSVISLHSSEFRDREQFFLPLAGDHQIGNLQVALSALGRLRSEGRYQSITSKSVRSGLRAIRRNSGIRGRFDVMRTHPSLVIVDVAHNPDGMKSLVGVLQKLLVGKIMLVFGVMKDKAYREMIRIVAPHARCVVAVQPQMDRALASQSIVSEFHDCSAKALDARSVQSGLDVAMHEARPGEPVVVTGSHYVVGETFTALGVHV